MIKELRKQDPKHNLILVSQYKENEAVLEAGADLLQLQYEVVKDDIMIVHKIK